MFNENFKNKGLLTQKPQNDKTLFKKLLLPIIIAVVDLSIIILLVLLFKNLLAIILVVVIGHLIFLVYLTKTLEREKVTKEKEAKARRETEKQLHEIRKQVVVEKQKRVEAEQKIIEQKKEILEKPQFISQITNIRELRDYIKLTLKKGFSQKEIKEALIKAGWKSSQIDKILEEAPK